MREKAERILYCLSTGVFGLLSVLFVFVLIISIADNLVYMCSRIGFDWKVTGNYMGLFAGIVVYVLLVVFLKLFRMGHNLNWFMKFTHELTHTLVAIAFFAKIHKFIVMDRECSVYYEAKVGYVPITLSPYCIPIYTFMLFPFRFAGNENYLIIFDFLIAFTYAFHVHSFIKQTRYSQPDISGCGKALSTTFITFVHLCVLSLIVATPKGGVMNALHRVFWEYPNCVLNAIINMQF
mgnify:FL=1